jgi:hypothetical protein
MKDEALKLALEAWQTSVYGSESHHKAMLLAMTNMAQAIAAQPAPLQEPVAWRYDLKQTGSFAGTSTEYSRIKLKIGENWTPLYTTPPASQRTWVGLTDEEIEQEFGFIDELLRDCVHRTEAKIKEKNNG